MKRFVYNQKYANLLVNMVGTTSQIDDLARSVHGNAGHLRIVLEQWHKEGIISKDKPGRDYQIKLTKKGIAISEKLAELMELVDHWKEPKAEAPKEPPQDPTDPPKDLAATEGEGTAGHAPLDSAIDPTLDKPKGKGGKKK